MVFLKNFLSIVSTSQRILLASNLTLLRKEFESLDDLPLLSKKISSTLDEDGQIREDVSLEFLNASQHLKKVRKELFLLPEELMKRPSTTSCLQERFIVECDGRFSSVRDIFIVRYWLFGSMKIAGYL